MPAPGPVHVQAPAAHPRFWDLEVLVSSGLSLDAALSVLASGRGPHVRAPVGFAVKPGLAAIEPRSLPRRVG